jgi:hypothetical protein
MNKLFRIIKRDINIFLIVPSQDILIVNKNWVLCAKGAFGSRGRNSQNEKQGWTVVIPSLPQSIEKTISMLKASKNQIYIMLLEYLKNKDI